MVRPKLRRRYNGSPRDIKSSGKSSGWDAWEGHLHHQGPTVLGNPVPRRERVRERERERERERVPDLALGF
jgi:hypothetical protein